MNISHGLVLVASFAAAAVMTPLVRALAVRCGIFDHPDRERKRHARPIPLWGGMALGITLALMGVVAWRMGFLTDAKIHSSQLIGIFLSAAVLIVGGVLDDAFTLRPWQQFFFPLAAIFISLASGIGVSYLTNPFTAGTGPYGRALVYIAPWAGSLITGLWLLGMTYTTKLLDGLDGLVTGMGVIGGVILFVVSLYWDAPLSGTSYIALMLAGACGGFLIYNFYPASVYLGEGGSTLIGYFLGVLSIISGAKIATTLLIMGIPILDVAWVIVRRVFFERHSFTQGDRKHLHFRLLDAGCSHRQAVLIMWGLTAFFGTASLFLQSTQKAFALAVLAVVMLLLAFVVLFRQRVVYHKDSTSTIHDR